jgi:hypothetical protein
MCPEGRLVVLSALAEGADRILAEEVLRVPGTRLVAVLPFELTDYARDFGLAGSPSSIHFRALLERASETHVMPSVSLREDGYARAAESILDRSDVLFAVWDGNPELGQGGTAEIVRRARRVGKPLVIIRAGNRLPGTDIATSLGADQGRLQTERLSSLAR